MMLKCPKCNHEMIFIENNTLLVCKTCNYIISDQKEIKSIKDCAMIEEDMEIWRKNKFFQFWH